MKKRMYPFIIGLNTIILLLCGLTLFLYSLNLLVEQTEERGLTDIEQIRRSLLREPFQTVALEQSEIRSARVIIVDEDSNLLADSDQGEDLIPGKFINASLMEAKKEEYSGNILRRVRTGILSVSTARKVSVKGRDVYVSITYNLDDERKLILFYSGFVSLLVLLVFILAGTISAYDLNRYRRPIKTLLRHTREAARGGFRKITTDSPDGVLKQLTEEFNSLVDRYNLLVEEDNSKYSRINTLLSNLRTGILMVDNRLEVTLVNPEAETLLNLNKLSLFHIRGQKEKESNSLGEILKKVREVAEAGESGSFSIADSSGLELDIDIEIMRSKYAPYGQTGFLIILRDVTEMRRLERLKDEFVANVSHELRTPLTVISGFVETLKSYESLRKEDRTTALEIIELETERLKKLIGELLLLSRIDGEMGHATKSDIDPLAAVKQVSATLAPMAERKKIKTELAIEENIKPLHGVPGWFRQIIYNLYENAIKYTPESGTIEIKLFSRSGFLVLEVDDSGAGIPEEDRERVFDRFFRSDITLQKGFSGNGIGLTIARHMVKEFDGQIAVEEGKFGGALFRVVLPVGIKRN